jgi:hypothetical protein
LLDGAGRADDGDEENEQQLMSSSSTRTTKAREREGTRAAESETALGPQRAVAKRIEHRGHVRRSEEEAQQTCE